MLKYAVISDIIPSPGTENDIFTANPATPVKSIVAPKLWKNDAVAKYNNCKQTGKTRVDCGQGNG